MALFNILVDIAARTASLDSGIQRATQQIEGFGNTVKKVTELVSGGLGAGALVDFAEHIISAGAELERAAVRVGTSGQAFSELNYAAKQTGVGTDSLANAMTRMNRALSEAGTGGKQQIEVLTALGLTFEQLKKLSPDQQFEILADRIQKLVSPADKARAEIALFGRAGGDLAPLLEQGAAGIEKMRSEAEGLGASLSDVTLKNLEEAHQSIGRLESSFTALATTLIGKVAPALSGFFDSITGRATGDKTLELKGQIEALNAAANQGGAAGFLFGDRYRRQASDLQMQLDALNQVQEFESRMKNQDMSGLLNGASPGFLPEPPEVQAIRINAQKIYTDKMKALLDEFNANTATSTERIASDWYKLEAELNELRSQGLISQQEYQTRIAESLDKILPGVQTTRDKIVLPVKDEYDQMYHYGEAAAQKIQGAFANFLFNPFHDNIKKFAIEFLQALQKMAADAAAAKIFQALFGGGEGGKHGDSGLGGIFGDALDKLFEGSPSGGSAGGLSTAGQVARSATGGITSIFGTLLKGLFGGGGGGGGDSLGVQAAQAASSGWGLADGGPVSAGSTYLVGEEGPELFTAASHGTITPNSDLGELGGATHVHMGDTHIDARGADADRIMRVLPGILTMHAARVKSDLLYAFRRNGLPTPPRA